MSTKPIDPDELHWKFARLQKGAAALERGFASLDDSSFREFLSTNEAGSAYCSRMYHRLRAIYTDYWKFRLALLWDLFPGRHAAALAYCQRQLEEAQRAAETFQRERPHDLGPWACEKVAGARGLLAPAKQVTTEKSAEDAVVVADICSWGNGLDYEGTLSEFYQHLEATLLPEQVERRPLPRDRRRH